MLSCGDQRAVATVGRFFDEIGYGVAWAHVVGQVSPRFPEGMWPHFRPLHKAIQDAAPSYRFFLTLFAQGHRVEDRWVRRYLSPMVLDAMWCTGLLTQDGKRRWRTPSLGVVRVGGLTCVTTLPWHYPTADVSTRTAWTCDVSTSLLDVMPPSLRGMSVLDVRAGCGLRSLIGAARGARRVTCVEDDSVSAAIARFNVVLNHLDDRVRVENARVFDGLVAGERFDCLIACEPNPLTGVLESDSAGGIRLEDSDHSAVLRAIFQDSGRWLGESGRGYVQATAFGDDHSIHVNRFLGSPEHAPLRVTTFVYRKETVRQYLQRVVPPAAGVLHPEWSPSKCRDAVDELARELLQGRTRASNVYSQLVCLSCGCKEPDVRAVPLYLPIRTDPLVRLVEGLD